MQRGPSLEGSPTNPILWLKQDSSGNGLSRRKTALSNKNHELGSPFCANQLGVTPLYAPLVPKLRRSSLHVSVGTRGWCPRPHNKGKPSMTTSSLRSSMLSNIVKSRSRTNTLVLKCGRLRFPMGTLDRPTPPPPDTPTGRHRTPHRWWPTLSRRRPRQERTVRGRGRNAPPRKCWRTFSTSWKKSDGIGAKWKECAIERKRQQVVQVHQRLKKKSAGQAPRRKIEILKKTAWFIERYKKTKRRRHRGRLEVEESHSNRNEQAVDGIAQGN